MDTTPAFLDRTNFRKVPENYAGDVLIWDIDKTYLDTQFSSVRGLLGIVLEAAVDKAAIPGAVPLIRALRRGARAENSLVPLFFVSGSPKQLRGILERKMLLDGVQFDGITFKDQLGYLRQGRPRAIKEQVGYKMCALLLYRRDIPGPSTWWLFGDDVEADANVMTLFGEACAGLRGDALRQRMLALGGAVPETDAAVAIADTLPVGPNPVQRVFIRLDRSAGPQAFTQERVAPVRSYLQAAMVLAHEGRIRPEDVSIVADDQRRALVSERTLQEHAQDAVERLGLPADLLRYTQR